MPVLLALMFNVMRGQAFLVMVFEHLLNKILYYCEIRGILVYLEADRLNLRWEFLIQKRWFS